MLARTASLCAAEVLCKPGQTPSSTLTYHAVHNTAAPGTQFRPGFDASGIFTTTYNHRIFHVYMSGALPLAAGWGRT